MEPMADGLHFYDDTVGVLTNNPPYPYQLMNLNNYRSLSPRTPANTFGPGLDLAVYGQGLGGLGLPGDASPMSRFVKAAFLRQNAAFAPQREGQVSQFFHILDAVSMVRGSVLTSEGRCDETIYACCCDAQEGVYYYHTYDSGCLHAVSSDRGCYDRQPLAGISFGGQAGVCVGQLSAGAHTDISRARPCA